jgi:EAL domain-containing protein (putative c-di-GMP-specific phosphodiesterase class I)
VRGHGGASGRDGRVSSAGGHAEAPTRAEIEAVLADPSQVALVFQPIVDLARSTVVGYESLARFSGPRRIGPDVWFAAATRHGLNGELTAAIMRHALVARAGMPANCFLTVNIEPHALSSAAVQTALAGASDLRGIFFELTEHADIDDAPSMLSALGGLRERGALIAIDDAGSGYSGLRQILAIRPQLLKLDRSLVRGIPHDAAKVALIEMLGELAGRLDAWLLAEGIEEAVELLTLSQLKVPLGQGYFLGRPAPPWAALTTAADSAMRSMVYLERDSAIVGALVEPCAIATDDAPPPSEIPTARLDEHGRLVWLQFRVGPTIVRRGPAELVRIKPESSLTAVAQRAVTRPASHRLDVLACYDHDGRFLGCVRVERMLAALSAGAPDAPAMRRRQSRRTSMH